MRASRFTDARKAFILKQGAEGMPVAEICRKAGIGAATSFNWTNKDDGPTPPEMRRLKQLEDENTKLRRAGGRPVARPRDAPGRHPPNHPRPGRKRELVDAVRGEWGVSIRRACRTLELDSSTFHDGSRRSDRAGLRARIREICATRVRYGYRRVQVLLRREGRQVNHARTDRLDEELGLQLCNETPKRRVRAKLRDDRQPAIRPDDIGAMDFLHDQLATGRRLRVLSVVDIDSRFSPVLDARFGDRGEDVVRVSDAVCGTVGCPRTIRVDQGSEFVSRDLDLCACARGVTLDFSRPGKPTVHAFAEAFNSRVRAECPNAHGFSSVAEARETLEAWRTYYNEDRPHGSIGHKPPIASHNSDGVTSPPS